MVKESGFYIDPMKRIVGPNGPTVYRLSDSDELFEEGKMTDIYIENGQFYRCRKRFWFLGCCSRTGHERDPSGKILGNGKKMPWD